MHIWTDTECIGLNEFLKKKKTLVFNVVCVGEGRVVVTGDGNVCGLCVVLMWFVWGHWMWGGVCVRSVCG